MQNLIRIFVFIFFCPLLVLSQETTASRRILFAGKLRTSATLDTVVGLQSRTETYPTEIRWSSTNGYKTLVSYPAWDSLRRSCSFGKFTTPSDSVESILLFCRGKVSGRDTSVVFLITGAASSESATTTVSAGTLSTQLTLAQNFLHKDARDIRGEYSWIYAYPSGGLGKKREEIPPEILQTPSNALFQLFPNPTSEKALFRTSGLEEGRYSLTFTDMNGRKAVGAEISVRVKNSEIEREVSLNSLSSGIYVARLERASGAVLWQTSLLVVK